MQCCEQVQWLQGQKVQGQGLDVKGQGHKLTQERTLTIDRICCATLWKCRRYDKHEPLYIAERLKIKYNRTLFKYTL